MRRCEDGEMGRWGDGKMGRWEDLKMGRGDDVQMRNSLKCIFGLLLGGLMVWTNLLPAQEYHTIRYTTTDGLVQSQVFALLQDRKGYLWFGTHRGICRFDGKRFKAYGIREGLSGSFIQALLEDLSLIHI